MIEKIELKSASSKGQPNLSANISPITIFVGPNNSGKSKILIEIEKSIKQGYIQPSDLILKNLEYSIYKQEEIENEIEKLKLKPNSNESLEEGHVIIGKLNPQNNTAERSKLKKAFLIKEATNPNTGRNYTLPYFLKLFTIRLDGTNRLNLLNEKPAGDFKETPTNHLAHLFTNNKLRKEVRRIVYEAFDKYYVIDPTKPGFLNVSLSESEPKTEDEERGWDSKSINFHKKALPIKDTSDGVKAFTGIITTILAGDPKIMLIDEPEAFLHPALSNKLGKEIGKSLRKTDKRLFAATHSSSFLMGCIQSGSPLNIIRLTYKNEKATSRLLKKEKILHLMRNPLLRSTGVLNGLFYEAVIVTEADSDRAFYQEINERLLAENDSRGIANCLFLNAQNKQTVWEIVKPLRELGIPTAGIVDLDVVKEGGQVFGKLLQGAFLPSLNHQTLQNQRKSVLDALNQTNKNWKIEGGINLLEESDKEATESFLDQVAEYGVFVIKYGELESWMKNLNISGHGPRWLIDIFEKMGENPEDENYIKPSIGDVWDFIGEINQWMENNSKKGIPK